jgi:two-component system sensor histidine kinase DesK
MAIAMLIGGVVLWDALLTGIGITVIGFVVFALNGLRRTNQALLRARADLARMAVLEERERIARDLHDTLGHSLSLITLKSELAGRLLPHDPDAAGREIGEVEEAAREALASVRQTVRGFRRPSLDGELEGLVAALRAAGIDPSVERSAIALPGATDALFAWALREGVTNVMRHSHASHCTIRIGRDDDHAFAEVVDDGVGDDAMGSDVTHPGSAASVGEGSGLRGLAERVADQGGEVTAGALPGRGYRLRITLPLAGSAA